MTPGLLTTVVAAARRAAAERQRAMPAGRLEKTMAAHRPDGAAFVDALRAPGVRVIAECKRRSPSRGVLVRDYDPVAIARAYEAAGAAAVSVLTEPTFFDGSLEHLEAVAEAVAVPVLRKDFVVTPFQVREAVAAGADAVLLIVGALDDRQLTDLLGAATGLGLAALVEVHDREELARALDAGAALVGVNSRDLQTLEVNRAVFEWLAPSIPADVTAVAESGLTSADDLSRLHQLRYDAFLIGERLVASGDPGAAMTSVLGGDGGGP